MATHTFRCDLYQPDGAGNCTCVDACGFEEDCPYLTNDENTIIITTEDAEAYWQDLLNLIGAVGSYQAAKKMYANYMDPDTRFKVESVVQKYYGSSTTLRKVRDEREAEFRHQHDLLRAKCNKLGVSLDDGDLILAELSAGDNIIGRYRRCLTTCLRRAESPFPLLEIPERKFRKPKKQH